MSETLKVCGLDVTNGYSAILTCPAGASVVCKSLIITNVDGTNTSYVSAKFVDDSETDEWRFCYQEDINPGPSIDILPAVLNLEEGDSIELIAENNSDLEAVLSYLLVT